jgi:multiple sugar transport system ATP-binding protein
MGEIMANVEIKNVTKSFGAVNVIKDISLKIEEGEFLVLVGPSGCGKSTLLRMIAGLEPLSSGNIHIGGRDVTDLPARERGISMVFQSYALYPHMTSAQNMSFSLRLQGESKETQMEKAKWASGILGLDELLDRLPKQLSGGQRQRVAMGRAIVRKPDVFLFDEPLSNLDAKLRVKMRAEIKELHQKLQRTTVYVTHDQIEAMTLADRIVVLRDGNIEQIGKPLDLYDNPANRFVGSFLGSPAMNFIEGEQTSDGTGVKMSDGETLALGGAGRTSASGKVTVGFRPEALSIVQSSGADTISAEVVVVEPTGADTEVILRKGSTEITAKIHERLSIRPGENVHLQIPAKDTHLFDQTTGIRM